MQKNKQNKNILCLVAGSSGGHIIPGFVLAQKWRNKNPGGKVIYLGSHKTIDKEIIGPCKFLLKKYSFKLLNFPSKNLWLFPKFFSQLLVVFIRSIICFMRYRPKSLLSTGGYLAIPVCMAAKLFRIPIEFYELNVVPGRAASFLFTFADKIFVTFEKCKEYLKDKEAQKCFLSAYPLRFNEDDKIFDKAKLITFINRKLKSNYECSTIKAATKLGCESFDVESFIPFDLQRRTIFIFGGSQGAIFINSLFKEWLTFHPESHKFIQVIHQTGYYDKTNWPTFYRSLKIPSFTFSFHDDLKNFYLIADLVVCRAGAGTLFELEFFRKKSLIIPHQFDLATHQLRNAQEMAEKHPDLFILQKQSQSITFFDENIKKMLLNKTSDF